ncbi:MAG: peptidylprolyl isomerase [Candidatus Margulisbacteria bacterium]|nr:peptidylprolyl isomerase [Candidatus Margulisiibacteriota bacterium]
MKKVWLVLVVVLSFFLFMGLKLNLAGSDKVILKVGDTKLTQDEINEKLNTMPPQYKEYYSSPEGKKLLIDNLKKEMLVYEMAKKDNYSNNKDVLDQMEKVKRQVIVAIYLRDKIDKKSEVTEADVKKYFKDHKDEFKSKDQVKAKHILVKTEEEAKGLIAKLNKGEDFGKLATEYSLDPSGKTNQGDLGWFSKGQMVKPFETAAFALEKGAYTKEPVQTQYGWHIILVEDKKPAQDLVYDDVKEDVKVFLTQKKQKEMLDELVMNAEKKIKVEDHSEQLLLKVEPPKETTKK